MGSVGRALDIRFARGGDNRCIFSHGSRASMSAMFKTLEGAAAAGARLLASNARLGSRLKHAASPCLCPALFKKVSPLKITG